MFFFACWSLFIIVLGGLQATVCEWRVGQGRMQVYTMHGNRKGVLQFWTTLRMHELFDYKLPQPLCRDRYYDQRFKAGANVEQCAKQVARDFLDGIAWVYRYVILEWHHLGVQVRDRGRIWV